MCRAMTDGGYTPATSQLPPISVGAIAALCLVSQAHAYSLSGFYAYAGFLTVDLHWALDLDHSGFAVGVLGAQLVHIR